jgi:pyruvate/2-oxoglutarate dehydrogenase complex dihydrolipoamide dehydrogenase (E3) component
MNERYDAVVIGTGQAGKPLAQALGAHGWRTAIVESEHVGGTCINVGCTPTKTMVASARVAYLASRAADYGVEIGAVRVDLPRVVERKRGVVTSFREGSQRRLEARPGVDLVFGEARFVDARTLAVRDADGAERTFHSETIFINTGGRPAIPPVFNPPSDAAFLTSTTILELETLPRHLVILGGGYVSVEFSQMFRRFGSDVTIVQRGDQLLTQEDRDVAEEAANILREDGVKIELGAVATHAARGPDGGIILTIAANGEIREIEGSHLLVATGREPRTAALDLQRAGVKTDERGHVIVDDRLQTNVPGIYALGDVKGGPAFTHIAYDDYRIIEANLLKGGDARVSGRLVPYTVFMDPELGRVGLTEAEARREGRTIRVAKLPMTHVARAIERSETRGFMKAIVDADTDAILGCAILGIEGGEIMSVVQVAMMGKLPYTALRDGVFSHPTVAESLNNLFMALDAE